MGRSKTKKRNYNRNSHASNVDSEQAETNENLDECFAEEEDQARSSVNCENCSESGCNQNNNMTNIFQEDSSSHTNNNPGSPTRSPLSPDDSNFHTAMEDNVASSASLEPIAKSSASTSQPPKKEDPVEFNLVDPDRCPHMLRASSSAGIRKAFKNDLRAQCQGKPCMTRTITDETVKSALNNLWFCLQCGSIGCGDQNAQGGDAINHFKTPRSDCHSIVLLLNETYKCWCFICQSEINNKNTQIADHLTIVKRNCKTLLGFSKLGQRSTNQPSAPIALGPPPPPPPPNPPKSFQNKKQQSTDNKISYSKSNSNSSDWPLGLENLGNTCFMNSALQCLSRTRNLIPALEMYGNGKVIEIVVSAEEPSVSIVKTEAGMSTITEAGDGPLSPENIFEITSENDKEDIDDKSSSSPASELDSVLEGAESNSSKEEREDMEENFTKEIEMEMKNPLKLQLEIPKESMTGRLKHAFKAITRHPDVVPGCEPYSHREFLHRNEGHYGFRPNDIHCSLSKQFRPMQQHDSHELLRTVVDMMKKDQIKAFRLAIMDRYGVKKSEVKNLDPKLAELLKQWDRKLYHKTFVDEIFGGELVTTQTCLQCKSVRRSHEDFLDLSLPIRVARANSHQSSKKYSLFDDDHDIVINRTLDCCLVAFTEPELLTGDNNVECENCHRINLEKLAAGASLEDIFPSAKRTATSDENSQSEEYTVSQAKGKSEGKQKRQEDRKKKRQPRQAKMKARMAQEAAEEKEMVSSGKSNSSSLAIVEDHFTTEKSGKAVEKIKSGSEDDAKSNKSGSLDDYVVINSLEVVNKNLIGKRKYNELEQDVDVGEEEDDLPALVQNECTTGIGHSSQDYSGIPWSKLSKGLSESFQNLNLLDPMDVNVDGDNDNESIERNAGTDADIDIDEIDIPAGEGAIDASDGEEGNGVPPLDLGFIEDPTDAVDMISVIASGNRDEGYSEGDNSSDCKNSRSVSASSSRNSACESEMMYVKPEKVEEKKKPLPVTKCPCSRQQMISRPPEFLTIHLKRFQMTARFHTSKISNHVEFPFILDLTSYCSETPEDCMKPGYKRIFDEDNQVVYSLYGIVEHSGSLHWGHYIAYIKVAGSSNDGSAGDSFQGKSGDKWFYISDSQVTPTTPSSINSRDAYILFYERIRGEEKKSRMSQTYVQDYTNSRPGPSYDNDWETQSTSYTTPMNMTGTVSVGWGDNWEPESSSTSTTPADTTVTTEYTLPGPSTFVNAKGFGDPDEGFGNDNSGFPNANSSTSTQYGEASGGTPVDYFVPQPNPYDKWMYPENNTFNNSSTYTGYGTASGTAITVPLITTPEIVTSSEEVDVENVRSADVANDYSRLEDVD